ncbi:MAG: ACP S-malonyltransferase [Candidatus Omnitrophota bacterium]
MQKKIAYIFPGQGAQYVGMGKDLFEKSSAAKEIFKRADKTLNIPLSEICFNASLEELTHTDICQPAILTVSIAALAALKENSDLSASFAAGLSLGEYSALVASEALSFEDGLTLVRKRGEFMESAAKKTKGKMASVIGLDVSIIRKACEKNNVFVANLNCPGQVVISGLEDNLKKASEELIKQGALKVIALEVSGAFHSILMKEASDRLEEVLNGYRIKTPKIEVISNVTAKPVNTPEEIKENLIRQIASSVLWQDSIEYMIKSGVSMFIEIGPGKVLKGLLRRIDPTAQALNIENYDDIMKLPN